jgi:hypothetical protein
MGMHTGAVSLARNGTGGWPPISGWLVNNRIWQQHHFLLPGGAHSRKFVKV